MASRAEVGGIKLTLGSRGLRFTRRPSAFNQCAAEQLRAKDFDSRAEARAAFTAAVNQCKLHRQVAAAQGQ